MLLREISAEAEECPWKREKVTLSSPRATRGVTQTKASAPRYHSSVKRKDSGVLELLRNEDLEITSWRSGITRATLSVWRNTFLASGDVDLKAQVEKDRKQKGLASEKRARRVALDNELLREKVRRLQSSGPLGWRRWKP